MDFMSPFWWLEIHPDPRFISLNPLKCQYHKKVKHTQTIHWEISNKLFECV